MDVTNEEFLDSIVYSGIDALMLGCIDKVGQVTYREAIAAATNDPLGMSNSGK